MPKHVPTFKHLIATSSAPKRKEKKAVSLDERLERSRAEARRRAADEAERRARELARDEPTPYGPDVGQSSTIHPAELLRRQRVAERRAALGVAGPAPPPSWRAASILPDLTTPSYNTHELLRCRPHTLATQQDLHDSARLLTVQPERDPGRGPPRLAKLCALRILIALGDETVSALDTAEDGLTEETWTMADILREQLRYLAPPLVTYILEVSAYQAERSCYRLQEDNLFHLLRIVSADGAHHEDDLPVEDVETEWDDDWDAPELATTALHHLAITLHPSPQTLLGRLRMPLTFAQTSMTSASSLTSLNLAYSTLPTDLDKLVNLLPSGLRELSLVGVRFRGETVRKADVNRGFASLGRKLIVLTTLDLSLFPVQMDGEMLRSLLVPPVQRLPSLSRLGCHGWPKRSAANPSGSSTTALHTVKGASSDTDGRSSNDPSDNLVQILTSLLRSKHRKYVEIID